ncbi:MAG: hypothetical protein ACXW1P_05970 [Methylophilaceae bacterium]
MNKTLKRSNTQLLSMVKPKVVASSSPPLFLYVKIPTGNTEPDLKWNEGVDLALQEHGIGTVLGWGSSMGKELPDGSTPIEFHRIDIEVTNLSAALVLLQTVLVHFNVPSGTEIHYKKDQKNLQDVYINSCWTFEQAATDLPSPFS